MKRLLLLLFLPILAAGCDGKSTEQLRTLAHADSLRQDSLVRVKSELLDDVMASSQFVSDINTELAKAKSLQSRKLAPQLGRESQIALVKEERAAVVGKIQHLVARLDSVQSRLESTRGRARALARHDSRLAAQVVTYEKTVADFRQQAEQQKAEFQAIVDRQTAQIASLTQQVDTIKKENVRLVGERTALSDTVTELTVAKNTAYYVIGTKDELIKKGVLVEEGRKRFLLVGSRNVATARQLDPTVFTRIDRSRDRVINFPSGQYTIFSRQNPAFASPFAAKGGKLAGGLRIDQPEQFWEPSKFLIIVRS